MADQAMDGRPDVEIRSTTTGIETDPSGEFVLVTHEAACRWCPESLSTPDIRSAVMWADAHEKQQYHIELKADRIHTGIGPRELWP